VAEAMEAVGADPAWIHAFRKTGLFVTEMNERLIPQADLAKWRSAIAEYRSGAVRRHEAVFERGASEVWLGGRDSIPDNVVQRRLTHQW
jgi:hypothetical protein